MNFQDAATFLIVAGAVAFLVNRFAFASRRRKKTSKAHDVPVEALLKKRKKR